MLQPAERNGMNIIEMQVADIVPYQNNPRKNDGAVDAVANSIREFGFKVPIIVDKDNVIVAGHTRLKAAEKLGLETVPVIRADDLTEEQATAFRLADNKTGEISQWDFEKLEEELSLLSMQGGLNMADFGFPKNEEYISNFFEEGAQTKNPEDDGTVAFVIRVPKDREQEFVGILDENGFEYSRK